MPQYSCFMNQEEDEILMAYGKILAKQGLIKNEVKRYGITKFILNQAVDGFKEQLKKSIQKPPDLIASRCPEN